MGRFVTVFAVMAGVLGVACSVTTTEGGSSPSGGAPSPSASGAHAANPPPAQTSPTPAAPTVSASNPPPASTVSVSVDIENACPAFLHCNANPIGTYDYTGGCLDDVFADAKKQCPAMQAVGVKADVAGSITLDGTALAREATAHVSGTLVFPADCTLGQCAALESALKSELDAVKCTPQSGGCNCEVSKTAKTKDVATYTIDGSTLKTDGGESYDICERNGTLAYYGYGQSGTDRGYWWLHRR